MKARQLFLGMALLPCFAFGLKAEPLSVPLVMKPGQDILPVTGKDYNLYLDRAHQETPASILAKTDVAPLSAATIPNFGRREEAFWLRLKLQNKSSEKKLFLELDYPFMESIDLWFFLPDGSVVHQKGGMKYPFSKRAFGYSSYLFALPFQGSRPHTLLLRLQTRNSMRLPLSLYTEKGLVKRVSERRLLYGVLYGVIAIMVFYNLFLYFALRDSLYIYYIVYSLASFLHAFSMNGHAFQYLWPNFPKWSFVFYTIGSSLYAITGIFFTKHILNLRRNAPLVNKALDILSMLFFLCIVFIFALSFSAVLKVQRPLLFLLMMLLYLAGFLAYKKGHSPAKYFLVAFSVFFIGALSSILRSLGFLPSNFWTIKSWEFGIVVELALLSLALADRIKELREKRLTAEARSEEKARLLAVMSHEIRNPLHVILGLIETLGKGTKEEERKTIESLKNSASMLKNLIDDILGLSRLESGKVSLNWQIFFAKDLFFRLARQYEALAKAKGLSFAFQFSLDKDLRLWGDAGKIHQVAANLLDNAVKYTQAGKVSFRVESCPAPFEMEFPEVPKEMEDRVGQRTCLRIQVEDTGLGIPEDLLPHIFESFHRGAHQKGSSIQGTGLGLDIVRNIIKIIKGKIEVKSQEGEGSLFALQIPLYVALAGSEEREEGHGRKQAEPIPKANPLSLPKKTDAIRTEELTSLHTLVVDDDVNILNLYEIWFPHLPLRYTLTSNPKEALKKLENKHWDLVILDLHMPEVGGLDLVRLMQAHLAKSSKHNHDTVFWAVTGSENPKTRAECEAAGFDRVFSKPLRFEALKEAIEDLHGTLQAKPLK